MRETHQLVAAGPGTEPETEVPALDWTQTHDPLVSSNHEKTGRVGLPLLCGHTVGLISTCLKVKTISQHQFLSLVNKDLNTLQPFDVNKCLSHCPSILSRDSVERFSISSGDEMTHQGSSRSSAKELSACTAIFYANILQDCF